MKNSYATSRFASRLRKKVQPFKRTIPLGQDILPEKITVASHLEIMTLLSKSFPLLHFTFEHRFQPYPALIFKIFPGQSYLSSEKSNISRYPGISSSFHFARSPFLFITSFSATPIYRLTQWRDLVPHRCSSNFYL